MIKNFKKSILDIEVIYKKGNNPYYSCFLTKNDFMHLFTIVNCLNYTGT